MNRNDINKTIKQMKLLISVYLVSLFLSALMFTLGLIYDLIIPIICSGIVGLFSMIGIFYCASLMFRLDKHLEYLENKASI